MSRGAPASGRTHRLRRRSFVAAQPNSAAYWLTSERRAAISDRLFAVSSGPVTFCLNQRELERAIAAGSERIVIVSSADGERITIPDLMCSGEVHCVGNGKIISKADKNVLVSVYDDVLLSIRGDRRAVCYGRSKTWAEEEAHVAGFEQAELSLSGRATAVCHGQTVIDVSDGTVRLCEQAMLKRAFANSLIIANASFEGTINYLGDTCALVASPRIAAQINKPTKARVCYETISDALRFEELIEYCTRTERQWTHGLLQEAK